MQAIRSILWIGPEAGLVRAQLAETESLDITWIRDAGAAASVRGTHFEACVLDLDDLPATLQTLESLGGWTDRPPLIVLVHPNEVDRLRERLPLGVGAPLVRDPSPGTTRLRRQLLERIEQSIASRRRKQPGPGGARPRVHDDLDLIGNSEPLRAALGLAERAAGGMATVLLHGETGTGKEIFAQAIHRMSQRREERFVAINCAAIPDSLLESELFGHMRGAFTGANVTKQGLFELARGGTLFLDEIAETSRALQAKLLRALQEKEIRPVGGNHDKKVDVRIIAASNRDLRVEATRGAFRQDLFYRLAVFPISLPALRKRGNDVIELALHFLAKYRTGPKTTRSIELSQAAADLLLTYPWPGNVRELENEIQRALTLAGEAKLITPTFLSEPIRNVAAPLPREQHQGKTLREIVAQVESQVIRRALANNSGRKARSARDLGITREGLYKKMKRLGIS